MAVIPTGRIEGELMKTGNLIRQKIARIAVGGRPRVLDLFAGCGGLSLGFHAEHFKITAAVKSIPMRQLRTGAISMGATRNTASP